MKPLLFSSSYIFFIDQLQIGVRNVRVSTKIWISCRPLLFIYKFSLWGLESLICSGNNHISYSLCSLLNTKHYLHVASQIDRQIENGDRDKQNCVSLTKMFFTDVNIFYYRLNAAEYTVMRTENFHNMCPLIRSPFSAAKKIR